MNKYPPKEITVHQHLQEMMKLDFELYERILESRFAYQFNAICVMAECADDWYRENVTSIKTNSNE